jgi:hypothetical protein
MGNCNSNVKRSAFRDGANHAGPATSHVARPAALVESLEQRRLCSAGLVYSVNIVGVAAPTQSTGASTSVAPRPAQTGFYDWTWWDF